MRQTSAASKTDARVASDLDQDNLEIERATILSSKTIAKINKTKMAANRESVAVSEEVDSEETQASSNKMVNSNKISDQEDISVDHIRVIKTSINKTNNNNSVHQ